MEGKSRGGGDCRSQLANSCSAQNKQSKRKRGKKTHAPKQPCRRKFKTRRKKHQHFTFTTDFDPPSTSTNLSPSLPLSPLLSLSFSQSKVTAVTEECALHQVLPRLWPTAQTDRQTDRRTLHGWRDEPRHRLTDGHTQASPVSRSSEGRSPGG